MHLISLPQGKAREFGLDPTRDWVGFYNLRTAREVKDAVSDVNTLTYPIGAWDENGALLSDFQIIDQYVPTRIEETRSDGRYPTTHGGTVTIAGIQVPVRYFA